MIDRPDDSGPANGAYLGSTSSAARQAVREESAESEFDRFRVGMRRFAGHFGDLPFATSGTCPRCGKVVPATYDRIDGGVVVSFDCTPCGKPREFHHDAIYTPPRSDRPGSPTHTLAGSPIRPTPRRLPRTVETLCPKCLSILVGRVFVRDSAVWMEKTCPEHGHFVDCVNRNAALYAKAACWSFEEHAGQQYPQVRGAANCPSDCGLCNQHTSSSCLANIDLTNRCNMSCPVCFANAGASGYVYEPSHEQIVAMLQALRDLRPIPATAVQFSGGEPTLHPDFFRIIAAAGAMGFSHIQLATNGIRLADAEFADRTAEAGLHTLYLQFDGIGEEAHAQTRNYPGLWDKKLACIENCRRTGMKVTLVPTIIRGVNNEQVRAIFDFAVQNVDVINAISYQPVSFAGRMDSGELAAQRYTLGDLAADLAGAGGCVPMRDIFPLSLVVPLSQVLQAITGTPKIRPSCHTDCASGTYFLVSPEGKAIPWPAVIDIEGLFSDMNHLARKIERRGRSTFLDKLALWRTFKRHFRADSAPADLTVGRFIRSLQGMVDKNVGRGDAEKLNYKTLMCAGMHFQDAYNFDVDRVRRCVILYSTPEGIYPFCTYNCGPTYRRFIEPAHARRPASRTSPGLEAGLESDKAPGCTTARDRGRGART